MRNSFKILLNIFKELIRTQIRSILHGRYFAGVEFINKKNIVVEDNAVIEQGTKLWATNPVNDKFSITVGPSCWIGRDVELQTYANSQITIMENVSIQDRCKILGSVYIGRDCLLAPDVFISSGNHHYALKPQLPIKQQDKLFEAANDINKVANSVLIEEDCWLGKNAMVTQGVTIGRGAVIGTNSVVNQNVPPYEIWVGTPAKLLKKRLEFDPPLEIQANRIEDRPYFYRGFDHSQDGTSGLLSDSRSICVLKNSDKICIFLSAKIHVDGILNIWNNDQLIFSKAVSAGKLEEKLMKNEKIDNNGIDRSDTLLPANILEFCCLIFKFEPVINSIVKGFSIYNIKYND